MAWRRFHNHDTPFPLPDRDYESDYYTSYPHGYLRDRSYSPPRSRRRPRRYSAYDLRDPYVERAGDLGWTLDYATAWLYRHLTSNRPEITDALDQIRGHLDVNIKASDAYRIFGLLDRVLFTGKLKHNVYMRWKSEATFSPGVTHQQGRLKHHSGIGRVCIELNMTPFDETDGDVDQMLDAIIHQMVHAFFCVACGAIPVGEPVDGRLLDGVEFCVIMSTIRDISRSCRAHVLPLFIYAECRRLSMCPGARRQKVEFIGSDAKHTLAKERPSDGQSHCYLDNSHVRPAEIKNWQVEKYSASIDLDMESKGPKIFDYGADNKMIECDRMTALPSREYIELIWNGKRIMAPRERALSFESILKPLKKDDKYELQVPECPQSVFAQLFNFFNTGDTLAPKEAMLGAGTQIGPPVLARASSEEAAYLEQVNGVVNHLQLFKVAEDMKFEELVQLVLDRLWMMKTTQENPITILLELYDDKQNKGPIHAELHKWAREFLKRADNFDTYEKQKQWYADLGKYWSSWYRPDVVTPEWYYSDFGTSNFEKIQTWFPEPFAKLYERNSAFRDDCNAVHDHLFAARHMYQPYLHDGYMLESPDLTALLHDRPINLTQINNDIDVFNNGNGFENHYRNTMYPRLGGALTSSSLSGMGDSMLPLRQRRGLSRTRELLSLPAPEPLTRPLWASEYSRRYDTVFGG
ncbi:hypothetical protein EJ03DRAFT_370894 [Teratosphaeria nubilosa]|uniref:SprT-like domain-containing protein n=1 Tax=Teratosphaeria nubilosa TaxID=161662 RepID=A0A6G1LMI8_9PEZI|nr:hypothetical protein EJ03DRAFT_370894 [Teratosphaeria nubilosa]